MTTISTLAVAPWTSTAGAPLRVVVVNGSPSEKSKTMGLVDVAVKTLRDLLGSGGLTIAESRIDVYRLGEGFTGALSREDVTPEVEAALRRAEEADLLIAATPVFRGSYTGMFKHFFDLVDQYALANKPVFLAATGGGDHHTLVLEHALRPLFGFFQAMTLPVAVFASSGDFDGTTLLNPRVYGRIERRSPTWPASSREVSSAWPRMDQHRSRGLVGLMRPGLLSLTRNELHRYQREHHQRQRYGGTSPSRGTSYAQPRSTWCTAASGVEIPWRGHPREVLADALPQVVRSGGR